MDNYQLSDLMEKTMGKIREMVDVNTIIGEPITAADGTTLIPVSKVSFGFASGGSEFPTKAQNDPKGLPFGGGSGAGVKITPVAFLVIKDGNVRILNVMPPASTTIDRAIERAPEVIDKISGLFQKDKEE
jgi:sporulation protein YtfJ